MSAAGALLVTRARPWSGARLEGVDSLRIERGRIVALGRGLPAAGARVVDADGATVTPGLWDAHLHFVPWARARRQCDLTGAATRAEALARVRAALAPEDPAPLVGRGWDEHGWEAPPERAALDALAPVRPVLLHRHDFHALWVNGAALRAAGVGRGTPDPEGGRFERDAAGEPTGVVREHAVRAFAALEAAAAPAVDAALLDAAAAALHALGVTAVHDFQREPEAFRALRALAARVRLRVLQHVGPEQLEGLRALGGGSGLGDDRFRIGALKLFADGTLGSRTAALLAPYADAGGSGLDLLAPDALTAAVRAAVAAGVSVAIHAIGDRAVRHALDAFAACGPALAALPLPPRIEHAQLVDPADLGRFAALGVWASVQPQHCPSDAAVARRAWGARCAHAYPWRSLLAAGASLAFGSDAPVEPPAPGAALAAALTRRAPDGAAFEPAEAVGLDAALRALTEAPARLAGAWPRVGALAPGAAADLVVWDRDLHAAAPGALAGARPALTAAGGEIVYESPRRGAAGTAARAPGTGG